MNALIYEVAMREVAIVELLGDLSVPELVLADALALRDHAVDREYALVWPQRDHRE